MSSPDRKGDRKEKRALAVQWIVCGAILMGFTEMMMVRVGLPITFYRVLFFFACLKIIIGAVTWHRASKTGD